MAAPNNSWEHQASFDEEIANPHGPKRRRLDPDNRNHLHDVERTPSVRLAHEDYIVGWICALPIELAAAEAMLDIKHESLPREANDGNTYTLGSIGSHNIVIACLPMNAYGTNNAATVAKDMDRTFPSIRIRLMVGIGGGVPTKTDIRLGDVVVSTSIIQHDMGKTIEEGKLLRTATARIPPHATMTAVSKLQAKPKETSRYLHRPSLRDWLFDSNYEHAVPMATCDQCDMSKLLGRNPRDNEYPKIHYGVIASSNQVMRHAKSRDRLAEELGVLCFEMEAAGLIDSFPCLAIRGICDYADSHKNKQWQEYAAATAAAYAKELLQVMGPYEIRRSSTTPTSSITGMLHFVSYFWTELICS